MPPIARPTTRTHEPGKPHPQTPLTTRKNPQRTRLPTSGLHRRYLLPIQPKPRQVLTQTKCVRQRLGFTEAQLFPVPIDPQQGPGNMTVIQHFLPVVIESRVREEGGLLVECRRV